MNVAIVGCGLIGVKRASALGPHSLSVACDARLDKAKSLAARFPRAHVCVDWREAVGRSDVDAVFVATPHDLLAPVALAAVRAGKHVLLEKPGARNDAELLPLIEESRRRGVVVKVGFNHRFHPGLQKARDYVNAGAVGELMFIRGRYGHGGRLGYEKEWRADPAVSGGGELLDQGVHLIDLSRWFLGDFPIVQGLAPTYFWNMPVDDNGFLMLRTAENRVAWLHVSWTEWKNLFSFEIYGKTGKLHVEGLGGSYGVERIAYYRMSPQMGPPEAIIHEFPGDDRSWGLEMEDFVQAIATRREPCGGIQDAYEALRIVGAVYGKNHP